MSDLISRQAAIDALKNRWKKTRNYEGIGDDIAEECELYLKQLPSTQPEPIRINLNEPIKVKLTDWGKEIYYHQYDRINQIAGREICKPRFPKEDENGYTEFQLWCFIELYGVHMGMTLPNVIAPLEIVYERVNRMSDLISRQAAIDALDEQIEQCDKSLSSFYISMKDEYAVKVERASLVAFRETLEYLLPAEPKTGRWIYCEDTTADCVDGYRCDQCGLFVPWDYQHKSIDYIKDYNFCPNCGAKMEVTE